MPHFLFLLFLGLVAVPPSGAAAPGTFTLTGGMSSARSLHTATLLGDGRVLVCGGADATLQALSTAEIYDPLTATFSPTGTMGTARFAANATLLPDGRVLIVGGEDSGNVSTTSVELFNPATGTFSLTGSLLTSRLNPTVTLLGNGLVLVAGGYEGTSTGTPLASAELYDPASGTFSLTGSMGRGAPQPHGHVAARRHRPGRRRLQRNLSQRPGNLPTLHRRFRADRRHVGGPALPHGDPLAGGRGAARWWL